MSDKIITGAQHGDTAKHVIDSITIPAGVLTAAAHYMDLINGVMTFLVLLTSFVWGVYRIIEIHKKVSNKDG